jgi:hypothetical protein
MSDSGFIGEAEVSARVRSQQRDQVSSQPDSEFSLQSVIEMSYRRVIGVSCGECFCEEKIHL